MPRYPQRHKSRWNPPKIRDREIHQVHGTSSGSCLARMVWAAVLVIFDEGASQKSDLDSCRRVCQVFGTHVGAMKVACAHGGVYDYGDGSDMLVIGREAFKPAESDADQSIFGIASASQMEILRLKRGSSGSRAPSVRPAGPYLCGCSIGSCNAWDGLGIVSLWLC